MSFFRDCWLSIRGNLRECMTTPLSRKKLLVFGGILLVLIIVIIILVVSLHGGGGGGGGGTPAKGTDALTKGVNGVARNDWLKSNYMYEINNNKNADGIKKNLDEMITTDMAAMMWAVGASNCSLANQKDAVSQTLESIDAALRLAGKFNSNLNIGLSGVDVQSAYNKNPKQVALLLALDGGYTIDSRLAVLRTYYALGVRIMTLTGNCSTPWAKNLASSTNDVGLTEFGQAVVSEATRLRIILDLARSSAATVKGVLSSNSAIIFNGVGAKSLTNAPENLDDDTLKNLSSGKNRVVLVSFQCELIKLSNSTNCTMNDVIKHIIHISQVAGVDNVGLAMDFGGTGHYPSDLANMTGVSTLFNRLHAENGWTIAQLEGLASQNLLKLLKTGQPSGEPKDDLEPKAELEGAGGDTSLVCYSDLNIRYSSGSNTSPPTAAPSSTTPGQVTATTKKP